MQPRIQARNKEILLKMSSNFIQASVFRGQISELGALVIADLRKNSNFVTLVGGSDGYWGCTAVVGTWNQFNHY